METQVMLTMKEQHKLKMVIDYEAKKIADWIAADLLSISVRHIRRLVAAYLERGMAAIANGNRGKSPVMYKISCDRQDVNQFRDQDHLIDVVSKFKLFSSIPIISCILWLGYLIFVLFSANYLSVI